MVFVHPKRGVSAPHTRFFGTPNKVFLHTPNEVFLHHPKRGFSARQPRLFYTPNEVFCTPNKMTLCPVLQLYWEYYTADHLYAAIL